MTDAERQRKRRERLRQERGPVDPSPAAIIDALRKENAALRRQVAGAATAAPVQDELVKARAEIDSLRKKLMAAQSAAPSGTLVFQVNALRREVDDLRAKLAKANVKPSSILTPRRRRPSTGSRRRTGRCGSRSRSWR